MSAPRMTPAQARAALATMTDADFPTADPADDVDPAMVARLVDAAHAVAGRPSLTAPGRRSPQVTVRLPEAVNARLVAVASQTGRHRSQLVRDAIDAYLARDHDHHLPVAA